MPFPPSLLDEIRARIPVSEVVGRRVQWDRRKTQAARGDFWACCPFHNEKTPSFHADDRKGRYHCFGCGAGGDIFTFLTETEGMPFPEAVEMLAREAGLEVPKPDPRAAEREEARTSLYEVMEKAARFFEMSLAAKAGREAAAYLERRGLSAAAISRFRLGHAPNARYALKEHLAGDGVTSDQMVEAGLLVTGDDIAVPFDRFRDRIMFPIPDSRGRIIAFGGRALAEGAQAKYLNSPETALFSKRTVLYNYAAARKAAQDRGTVIVAEGYMDVIALVEAGFENAVAPLGTALTERQLALLWRLAPEPVLCFDGDAAGQRAAIRAAETALPDLKPGYSLRFAFLPEGQDPDDLIRGAGAGAFETILQAASPLIAALWESECRGSFDTPEQRAALDARFDAILGRIGDERVRRHYRDAIAERLSLLWREAARAGGRQAHREPGARQVRYGPARRPGAGHAFGAISAELRRNALARGGAEALNPREALLLVTAINHPSLIEAHAEELAGLELASPELDSLAKQIIDIAASAPGLEVDALKDQLRVQGFAAVLERMERALSHGGDWFARVDASPEDAEIAWQHMVARQHKAVALARELRVAEHDLARDPGEETGRRLAAARAALDALGGNEVAIDGYGRARGRSDGPRSFDDWLEHNRHRLP
jgi:DNA primase